MLQQKLSGLNVKQMKGNAEIQVYRYIESNYN